MNVITNLRINIRHSYQLKCIVKVKKNILLQSYVFMILFIVRFKLLKSNYVLLRSDCIYYIISEVEN